MKNVLRRVWLVAFVLLVTGLLSVSAFADNTTAVSSSEFHTHQGETFTTTIFIPDGANIVDFDITLTYDTEKLTLVRAEENDGIKGTVIYNDQTPGELLINYTRTSRNVTSYLPLLDVTFLVDDNVGVGSYDCFTVDRSKAYLAHRLNSAGSPESISFDCNFAKLVIYEMGDVDLSGGVDIADATRIRRHLAEFADAIFPEFNLTLADTHYDGVVDVADAGTLQRHLARFEGTYGNRVNVTFYDKYGNKYATKSVLHGGSLHSIPAVPAVAGFSGGMWSQSADSFVAPVYSNLQKDVAFYACYSDQANPAMDYYKKQLTTLLYSGDMPTNLSSDLGLVSTMNYQNGWHAAFLYSSDCNYVVNSTTGAFTKPTYPQKMNLTVSIISYDKNNKIDSEGSITFAYDVPGIYQTPTKADVEDFLKYYFTDDTDGMYRVNYDVKLISKLNSTIIPVEGAQYDNFEIRLSWYQNVDGSLVPIKQIKRTTTSQHNDYVAVATFNGKPLEDDGKIYIDNVEVTAIDQIEIKNHIINQIAANMGTLATEGTVLWNNDEVYGTNVTWETGAPDIGYVANNIVRLKSNAVSGSTLPLNARVSYAVDDGSKEFVLAYNLTVSCDNTIIKAPENMDPELYRAIKTELEETLGYRGDLTSAALADVRFVNLNLSDYPDIASLRGLSFCKNLRTLNISGLRITDGTMNQIATLSYLEAFIARGCGLDNLTDGGTATLRNAVNLKMIDLTDNNFTSLDSVFTEGVKYGSLREVYLSKNKLTDINALSRAPMMTYLSLSENGLTTQGTACLENYPYLVYLSLANNQIDSVEHLKGLSYLKELRLQHNRLSNVNELRRLINLEILYLGHNSIRDIGSLNSLTKLQILYVNDNSIFDISALRDLGELECINVSNNNLTSLAVLNSYKATLTEIYAENNKLTDFSFISGASNLHILMLSGNQTVMAQDNMVAWLSGLTKLEILTLSGIRLNDLSFLANAEKLVRLDVANCGLNAFYGETSNLQMIADHYATLKVLDISNNDLSDGSSELLRLRNATLLTVLYADNVCSSLDAYTLTYSMTELKYVSLEGCGVTTTSWLNRFHDLKYVDLAGNCLSELDLDQSISNASLKTLKELYLDTTTPCTFANAFRISDFNVERLSLCGVTIDRVEYLPNLDEIRYLNLDGTGLTNLAGEDAELSDIYSVARYGTLETIDVSNLEADITSLEQIDSLQTIYAVGSTDSMMFHECNLHSLQRLYDRGVTCYLYNKEDTFTPMAQVEGSEILSLLPDYSCNITVAADYVISDNNPLLPAEINDFDIDWSISNQSNYSITNNRIKVKNYTDLDDETLVLTAAIKVYPDQQRVSRDFLINTHVLRVSDFAEISSTSALNMSAFNEPSQLSLMSDTSLDSALYLLSDDTEDNDAADAENGVLASDNDADLQLELLSDEENVCGAAEVDVDDYPLWLLGQSVSQYSGTIPCLTYEIENFHDYMTRSKEFRYRIGIQAADYPGFSTPVKPVVDDIRYAYNTILSNGKPAPYTNVLNNDGNGNYSILSNAPLGSVTTITTSIGHMIGESFIPDETMQRSFEISSRNYTITYVTNGGTVTLNKDGSVITTQELPEDSVLFQNITVSRTGYLFDGWFTDSGLKQLFSNGTDEAQMPAHDLTLYAKWTAHSYYISFDANGGTLDAQPILALCGAPIGNLPEPKLALYTFVGWYTEKNGGDKITAASVRETATDLRLYAHWTPNQHTVTFKANYEGGTVSNPTKTVTCNSKIGNLPPISRNYYSLDGWYDSATGGNKYTSDTVVKVDKDFTLYAHWTKNKIIVSFNANEGSCEEASRKVTIGDPFGKLPTPQRDYYKFDYWYLASGNKVTENSTSNADVTVYAHWTPNAVSDWVLKSEKMPAGAQIVSTKWTIQSTKSSVNGFTLYNTTSAWGNYGSWSGWSDSQYYASDSRQIETRSVVGSYDLAVYVCGNSYGTRCYLKSVKSGYTQRAYYINTLSADEFSRLNSYSEGSWYSYAPNVQGYIIGPGTGYAGASLDWVPHFVVGTHDKTQWRYRDRSLIYTYYLYKIVDGSASSAPSGDGISNVQQWVQYRLK